MKKFLSISLMAVLLLSSCVEENVIERSDDHAIVFENTFVDKATRSDITTENIDEFSVYGYKNSFLGTFWDNERVYKRGSSNDAAGQSYATPTDFGGSYPPQTGWTYENLAYWEEGSSYYIHGIAPYEDKNDSQSWSFVPDKTYNPGPVAGTISVNNSNFDLVYAYHERAVKEGSLGMYLHNQPAPISFTFQHLFARVRIRIVNELSNKHSVIYAMNLNTSQFVTEASAKVPFTDNVEWVLGDEKSSIACLSGNETRYIYHSNYDGITANNETSFKGEYISDPFYVIPQSLPGANILFSFTAMQYYSLMFGDSKIIKAMVVDPLTFEAGKSYQFTIRLKDENFFELFHLIQFDDIEVTDWGTDNEEDALNYK